MRTDLLITTTTRMTKTTSRMVATTELMTASLLRPGRVPQGFRGFRAYCYVTDRKRVEPAGDDRGHGEDDCGHGEDDRGHGEDDYGHGRRCWPRGDEP